MSIAPPRAKVCWSRQGSGSRSPTQLRALIHHRVVYVRETVFCFACRIRFRPREAGAPFVIVHSLATTRLENTKGAQRREKNTKRKETSPLRVAPARAHDALPRKVSSRNEFVVGSCKRSAAKRSERHIHNCHACVYNKEPGTGRSELRRWETLLPGSVPERGCSVVCVSI